MYEISIDEFKARVKLELDYWANNNQSYPFQLVWNHVNWLYLIGVIGHNEYIELGNYEKELRELHKLKQIVRYNPIFRE